MTTRAGEPSAPPRILIAGIGNIFLGDDAFGSEVARRMRDHPLPDGVRVVDFGIRGLDLAYALLDDPDATILVDAVPRGGSPGTLYLIEPDPVADGAPSADDPVIEAHAMDPVRVLRMAAAMGSRPRRVLVVGCEPATLGSDEDPAMGLSPPVEAAADEAITLIESLVERLLAGQEEPVYNSGWASPTDSKPRPVGDAHPA
jgi:hydrogenase maturation protease